MVILPSRRREYVGIDSYTKLLLHFDGADESTTFTDEIGTHTPTAAGHAQLDTAQAKFGVSSVFFDAAGDDYISIADHADWDFGSGDFTIDFQIRPTSVSGSSLFVEQRQDNDNYFWLYMSVSGTIAILQGSASATPFLSIEFTLPGTMAVNKWTHVALARNATVMELFIDGVKCAKAGTPTDIGATSWPNLSAAITFNGSTGNAGLKSAWWDELRVSKGICRWTSNFWPPRLPYR